VLRTACQTSVPPDGVQKTSALGAMIINQSRGPGGWNLDPSVFRSFPLGGTHRIEARVEASNVTNKTNFGNRTSNLQSGDSHAHLRVV
jgi:hypothetical protein